MAVRIARRAAGFVVLAALSLAAASAMAQTPQPLGFAGRWEMVAAKSHFAEGVTGPAPAAADVDVTKDDGAAFAWTLVEHDGAVVDASEFGDAALDGSPARIVVDGVFAPVVVKRAGPHAVDLTSNLGSGAAQKIHLQLSPAGVLVIDETLTSPTGKSVTQHLEFVRAKD
jgi:hypothetical protein